MDEKKRDDKPSFITEARRAQIIDAAITTLDEIGFANASLAQIARRSGISTALISYHFHDKQDLMIQTLQALLIASTTYVQERVRAQKTPREKLEAFITASLAYQGTHPRHNAALVEILFHARTPDGIPFYKLDDDEADPLNHELQQILQEGQQTGEFRAFHVVVMASAIRGAISEYMLTPNLLRAVDLETYTTELVTIFNHMILSAP